MEYLELLLKYAVYLSAPSRFFSLKIVFIIAFIVAAVRFILYKEQRWFIIIIIHLPIWRETSVDRLLVP